MKKITTIALLMLMALGANAQKDVFNKYKDMEGVSIVRMPKSERVSEIRILSCVQKSLGQKIKADAQAVYTRDEYEEMMRINEEGQRVVIYQRVLKSGKNEFALFNVGDSNLSIINITGILTLEDMKQFTVD